MVSLYEVCAPCRLRLLWSEGYEWKAQGHNLGVAVSGVSMRNS